METEETRAALAQFFAVRNSGDKEALMALMTEDVRGVWPDGAPIDGYQGPQALAEVMTSGSNMDQIGIDRTKSAFTQRRVLVDGNVAVVEAEINATTKFGTTYNNVYITIYQFDDSGRLQEMSVNTDTIRSARQLPWAFAEKVAELQEAVANRAE